MLVRFRDLNDPNSIVGVDPGNLQANFGAGVLLRRITIQMVDEDVTLGIEKRLWWLDNLKSFRSDPSNPFTSTLPPEIAKLRSPK